MAPILLWLEGASPMEFRYFTQTAVHRVG